MLFGRVCFVCAAVMRVHCVQLNSHVNAVGSILLGFQVNNCILYLRREQ